MDYYSGVCGGGVHIIDLMQWLLESKITCVSAVGNKVHSQQSKFKQHDLVNAILSFDNGVIGSFTSDLGCVHPHFHVLDVYGTRGTFINQPGDAILYTERNNSQPKLDVGEPLFTAGGVKAAFRHVFVSFPKGEFELQTTWEESRNPLSSPTKNPSRFRYQYRGLNAERAHVVGITGKYAFADSGEQSKVLKIDHEQISGKLVTDARKNYVKRVDLELLLKTTAGQGRDAITTEQSDTQSIAIEKE